MLRRIRNYYQRNVGMILFRRPIQVCLDKPLISFTFDDFPRSALSIGGRILEERGLRGTYYVSLGCLGLNSPVGPVCSTDDVIAVLEHGHELGCHTFSHCHSWKTDSGVYEQSIIQNCAALNDLIPSASFRSFAYPISAPGLAIKRNTARHFVCCRGGGQRLNIGTADLNQLSAYFLEKSRDDIEAVKTFIDLNRKVNGWIIFATHDVTEHPSPFGCTPAFFDQVVAYAVQSGAEILPVMNVIEKLRASSVNERTPVGAL